MNSISIVDVIKNKSYINKKISINGWVRTKRNSKIGISFISVNDGSCFESLQIVVKDTLYNYKNDVLRLTTGCSISVTGVLTTFIKNNRYQIEIHAQQIKVLGYIDDPGSYPISPKYHSIEYLREVSHLRPRTNIISSVIRIRNTVSQAIHYFMNKNGFIWISTPLLTTLNAEGAGKMFNICESKGDNFCRMPNKLNYEIDSFFGKKTFLTVSGQLNAESYACALSKVYSFGPVFRAETSNTNKHLSEFWMVEPEIAFYKLDDISYLIEDMLKYIFKFVLKERSADLNYLSNKMNKNICLRLQDFVNRQLQHVEYAKVIDILNYSKKKFKHNILWGEDLFTEHERYLTDEYFKSPILIKNYPQKIKAFYMRINDDKRTVASLDVIFPDVGEIIGGSEREERLLYLDKNLKEKNISKNDYWWYRELRKYGTVPHAGFGLGFDRLVTYVTGMNNIRDVIPFPRYYKNANF